MTALAAHARINVAAPLLVAVIAGTFSILVKRRRSWDEIWTTSPRRMRVCLRHARDKKEES